MSYEIEIGNFVTFFSLDEEFNHIKLQDVDEFVDNAVFYEVADIGENWLDVKATDGIRTIHVGEAYDEYQVHTKEQLRKRLKDLKNEGNTAAICAKIRQLYRKQEFQFKGV